MEIELASLLVEGIMDSRTCLEILQDDGKQQVHSLVDEFAVGWWRHDVVQWRRHAVVYPNSALTAISY